MIAGPPRRAVCLAAALGVAKCALVILRARDGAANAIVSPWAPAALLYRDALLVAALLLLDGAGALALRRRPWAARVESVAAWVVVGAVVGWAAINVPVARLFGSPLTRPMLAAAGGALWDSIRIYVTVGNLLAVLAPVAAALGASRLGAPGRRATIAGLAALALLVAFGPLADRRVEAGGLGRDAALTLVASALAPLSSAAASREPEPLPPDGPASDLRDLAGSARGANVLWVVLESHGARYLAPWGAPRDPTPNLSRLAARSLVLDSIYAAYPESIKGLWGTLCATHPAASTPVERYRAGAAPCRSVAERFAAAGYRTALFHSGRFVYLGMRGVVDGRGFEKLADAGDVGGEFASSFGVDEPSTVAALLAWLDGLPRGARFFVMYLPIAGHHPYRAPGRAPRPFGDGSDEDSYASDLAVGDRALGQLLDGLRARGHERDTLVVVNGDHGEAFQQHPGNFGHTLALWEENVHVPALISLPGQSDLRRAPQVGSTIDLAPTLLALVGVDGDPGWQGRSLLAPRPGVARFFTDQTVALRGLRQGRWKLIREPEVDRDRLFDLERDPRELHDVAASDPARVARYRAFLDGAAAAQRARILGATTP